MLALAERKVLTMQVFSSGRLGRLIQMGFGPGDFLLEGIRQGLTQQGVQNAVLLSGIGTLKRVRYHRVTTTLPEPTNAFPQWEAPIEISSISGLVVNGEPHLHMTFSDLDSTQGVHLEDGCEVLYLAELMFAEVEGVAWQRLEDAYGVKLVYGCQGRDISV